ncbi:Two-component response regulator SSK1p, partial [Cryomyces antarcticus]
MGDLKNKLRLLTRKGSATSVGASSSISQRDSNLPAASLRRKPSSLGQAAREREPETETETEAGVAEDRERERERETGECRASAGTERAFDTTSTFAQRRANTQTEQTEQTEQADQAQPDTDTGTYNANDTASLHLDSPSLPEQPLVTLEEPTPELPPGPRRRVGSIPSIPEEQPDGTQGHSLSPKSRLTQNTVRKQSLVTSADPPAVGTLLETDQRPLWPSSQQSCTSVAPLTNTASMLHRKIWVKRPGASATLVQIREDDLVDDVRDMILKRYANALGRSFDAPDVTLRIVSRHEKQRTTERILGPEEEMCRTLDAYFPGGQTVDEALIIEVPQRRSTPRPSPRAANHTAYHALDDYRPVENGTEYFPPMPAVIPPSAPVTSTSHDSRSSHHVMQPEQQRSISILTTGHAPPLPSPGGRRHQHRPKFQRQQTSSPTIVTHPSHTNINGVPPGNSTHAWQSRPRLDGSASDSKHPSGIPPAPPLPAPPAPEAPPTNSKGASTPPQSRVSDAQPTSRTRRGMRRQTPTSRQSDDGPANTPLPTSLLDSSVPPINVLIVEDNIINLKLLEAFMKRLKVRWQTAMNGQIAVQKWRTGGFHLVLMDIQLPIMSGLEATKEIRRLERVNGVGVFSNVSASALASASKRKADAAKRAAEGEPDGDGVATHADTNGELGEQDKL